MGVSRYPLEGENFCGVVGEHSGNHVDDWLCVGSLEAPARKTFSCVPATAQLGGARVSLRGLAGVQEKLPAAFRAVKHAADPVRRPRNGTAALVTASVRHVS